MGLSGKVAVVYSGARGIGKAYCEALLQKGCKVYFGDILNQEGVDTQQELQEKYKDSEIIFKKCDVLDKSQVKDLMSCATSALGPVEIVIANAGIIEERDWERCLELNLGSILRVFYVAMDFMSKTQRGKGGHFVATSSSIGLKPMGTVPVYTATKHGIVGFVRAWGTAENYKLTGVKCNSICPQSVDTKLLWTLKEDHFFLDEHCQTFIQAIQKGSHLCPSDVGESLIKLLENEEANGQCLEVSRQGSVYATFMEEPK